MADEPWGLRRSGARARRPGEAIMLYVLYYIILYLCLGLGPSTEIGFLHSAKGGVVETGCSDLHDVMY